MTDLASLSREKIGSIINASLTEGSNMKLNSDFGTEKIKAGKFLVVEGDVYDFFAIITDVRLATTNPDTSHNPPDFKNEFIRKAFSGTTTYTIVSLRPMLLYNKVDKILEPVKAIPSHFAGVAEATDGDIEIVFGSESLNYDQDKKYFWIGSPLDMSQPVCLDLERFTERSSAVFGRTGTGKTFITRLLLAGFIKTEAAVNLVFDVHNEYGTSGTSEDSISGSVKGLQPLFGSSGKVKVYSLDPVGTRRRNAHCDRELKISVEDIDPGDILLLQEELRLNPTAAEYTNILKGVYKKTWLTDFLNLMKEDNETINEFATKHRLLPGSLDALYRRLHRIEKDLTFIDFNPHPDKIKIVDELIDDLQKGISVVIEFGKFDNMISYLLVANIITRRVEVRYKEKTDTYLNTRKEADKPKQLVITIEEAHKFLNLRAASQTSFGKIARELRKYFVSLLIVDQRPSGIDDEILSQIGTKIVAALSDEKDINAVLSGVSNAGGMKSILASLDPKQQALIIGHGTPMPVVIRTRNYDEVFYAAMSKSKFDIPKDKKEVSNLFPQG